MPPEFSPFIHFMRTLQQSLRENIPEAYARLWYIDTVHNHIEFFDETRSSAVDVTLLFQDEFYLRNTVAPEDREAVRQAVALARRQATMSVLFRVRDEAGTWSSMVLMGMSAPDAPLLYIGMIACCDGLLERSMGGASSLAPLESIALLSRPVLLVSFTADRRILHANKAARILCHLPEQGPFPTINELFELMNERYMQDVYESLLFSGWWRGTLPLNDKERPQLCSVHIRPLTHGPDHFLWMQLRPVSTGEACQRQPALPQRLPDFSSATSEQDLLRITLRTQPEGAHAEGVILSRIFPEENRVVVRSEGDFPKHLNAAEYPYPGSIAENIVRYGLEFLMVDETTRSIRPIDWALFIPQGVHSYYAEPYFVDGKISLVLIYTSSRPNMFANLSGGCCKALVSSFANHLARVDGIQPSGRPL